jgi:hypothetical protein
MILSKYRDLWSPVHYSSNRHGLLTSDPVQNRRQTDRRKSRPLLPHELVPHFRNGVPIEVLQHSPLEHGTEHETHTHSLSEITSERMHSPSSSIHELLNPSSSAESLVPGPACSTQERAVSDASPLSSFEMPTQHSHCTGTSSTTSLSLEQDDKTASCRKRAHAEMTGIPATPAQSVTRQAPKQISVAPTVRLSMTAEGAVKIRTSEEGTPSPPKERAMAPESGSRRSGGLQRSKSAIGASEIQARSSPLLGNPKVANGKLGRSRDARTWEFYCDSEARDSLSSHAEHESNGSAVGAINLIRSQSQRQLRQMLAPVASRNNARAPAPLGSNGQRSKPKLARAKSSLARLQGDDSLSSKQHGSNSRTQIIRSPSGDSDKENWAPGTHSSQNLLRRTSASTNTRPVLSDNTSMLSYATGLEGTGHRAIRRMDGKDRRERMSMGSKAKGSDLDCVQGLLSLSQGAWR